MAPAQAKPFHPPGALATEQDLDEVKVKEETDKLGHRFIHSLTRQIKNVDHIGPTLEPFYAWISHCPPVTVPQAPTPRA